MSHLFVYFTAYIWSIQSSDLANQLTHPTAFARSLTYIDNVQRDSSSPGSTEARASPDSTMSPGVFNHVSSPEIADVSSRLAAPTTLHARVPINGPDISSPLPTPSPETPLEESFSRANDSNSRSWTTLHPRRDDPDNNVATTSLRAFPNSLLNPITPPSTDPIHKPARTSILSAFRSLDSTYNPVPSHFTPTLVLPSTSSTSGPSNYNVSSPASRIAPIAPTPPSSSPSSSAHTANMHLASPPPTPTSMLAQAHATASCHILPQVYQDIGGDMDCEGPCVDCEMRRYEHYGRCNQSTDSQEQSAEETRDQSTAAGSLRTCSNTSSGEIGTPSPEAQPGILGVPLSTSETQNQSTIADPSRMCFDPSSGESQLLGANAEASPHLDAQLEGPGVEKEVSISAFELQHQSTTVDSPRMCLDRRCGELDQPSRSFEANAEASPHVPGIEPEVLLPASEVHPKELGGELKATESAPSSKSPLHAIDLDALQRLIHGHELPLWHGLGAARMHEDGEPLGSGHMWTDEYGEVNGDFGGPSLEEGLRLGHTPDTGGPCESGLDSPNEPENDDSRECEKEQSLQIEYENGGIDGTLGESFKLAEERSNVSLTPNDTPKPANSQDACSQDCRPEQPADSEDSVQPETALSELRQPTPSDPTCLNADYLDQYEDLRAEDSREQTPTDSLFRDEEAVAAALTALSPSAESESPPLPSSPEGLTAYFPLQPESEASCAGVQGRADGPSSQEPTEILDDGDDIFTTFVDFMNAYTDGATSALRSTYTEDLVEQEPAEMHVAHEPAVTIDHPVHVESETTISAELSALLEHTSSVCSPPTFATPPPNVLPSSLSHLFRSLSPLSSLGESSLGESPPILQEEIDAGDEEGQDEVGVELRRTENLDSDEDSGVHQCRARSGSSVSVLRRKMLLRSLRSGELRGGPGASIEELSMLAKKDPRKIMISELKRKLEPLESAIQSRPQKKKTRFHADIDATSFSTDDVTSSFTYLAHQLQCQGAGNPIPQSSDPSESAEDVMSLQVESISAPMEVDSASVIGTTTISEPAQTFVTTSEMTKSGLAAHANEPWEDSISRGKRVRPLSWKASQASTQKNVQQSERNGKPKSRRPQKRKSKSLVVKEEAQMCQWPAKSEQDGSFQRQFVQCDKSVFFGHFILWSFLSLCSCDLWYHFGCAGFSEGDPRLEEPDSVFICPPCWYVFNRFVPLALNESNPNFSISSRCSCHPAA
ncbi:hypothetical protein F4604DRAFT_686581 [Suillus subluteus]|nr:hypothetical protein F4604DRAFT_686581 [Suillus subluteus]